MHCSMLLASLMLMSSSFPNNVYQAAIYISSTQKEPGEGIKNTSARHKLAPKSRKRDVEMPDAVYHRILTITSLVLLQKRGASIKPSRPAQKDKGFPITDKNDGGYARPQKAVRLNILGCCVARVVISSLKRKKMIHDGVLNTVSITSGSYAFCKKTRRSESARHLRNTK